MNFTVADVAGISASFANARKSDPENVRLFSAEKKKK
jgi:hypothetical protein